MHCPACGKLMKLRDHTKRIIKSRYGACCWTAVPRYLCPACGVIRRELPENVLPFLHYEKDVVLGVLEGFISSETLGFEDYPCEATMERWKASQKLQSL